jgi:fumarate reductase subunit C
LSGGSGLLLAFFMWGHMFIVGSILLGDRGFDWVAQSLEHYRVAQPTVIGITSLFLLHAVLASRKIPAQLRDRRRLRALARQLGSRAGESAVDASRFAPHTESILWIWQVRSGMVVLVLGSFHLVLVTFDLFSPSLGARTGIEAATSTARVAGGLWILYALLLVCVEFHAGAGLYRLSVKWGAGALLSRGTLHRIEQALVVLFLGFGLVTLCVLAGWLQPPLAFLLEN